MEDKKQEAPKEKQVEHPPRDYFTRIVPSEKGQSSGINRARPGPAKAGRAGTKVVAKDRSKFREYPERPRTRVRDAVLGSEGETTNVTERTFMEHDLKQPSILRRFFASLPVVGTPVSLLIEHTEMGMAQYGTFLGLLRGLFIGLAIAVALIVSAEAVTFGFEMVRYEFGMRYLEGWKSERRVAAQERGNQWDRDHTLLFGDPISFASPMKYFLVSDKGEADGVRGKSTAAEEIAFLDEFERQSYRSSDVKTLPAGETFTPFVYPVGGFATVDTKDKGECVVAARGDGSVILIPTKDYLKLQAAK